jgi:hypothetical protein
VQVKLVRIFGDGVIILNAATVVAVFVGAVVIALRVDGAAVFAEVDVAVAALSLSGETVGRGVGRTEVSISFLAPSLSQMT